MKQGELLKKLKKQGCLFVKHGKKHDKYIQPKTGRTDLVPRHPKIDEDLAWKIIRYLS
jgi:predicted RNA binding protein YcfA (HicA-like mRNA interferase family)